MFMSEAACQLCYHLQQAAVCRVVGSRCRAFRSVGRAAAPCTDHMVRGGSNPAPVPAAGWHPWTRHGASAWPSLLMRLLNDGPLALVLFAVGCSSMRMLLLLWCDMSASSVATPLLLNLLYGGRGGGGWGWGQMHGTGGSCCCLRLLPLPAGLAALYVTASGTAGALGQLSQTQNDHCWSTLVSEM